jgi:methylenetetrahydrofolate dehydrogenase (NADP+) / methenyltetrahydrofolate cyclohydrolase
MTHEIKGRKILEQVKSLLEIHRNNLRDELSRMEVVIFQFEQPEGLLDNSLIGKYKAADASTEQKCRLFGGESFQLGNKLFDGFLGCKVTVTKLPHSTTFAEFDKIISVYNNDQNVKGIIIQHPIPVDLNPRNDPARQIVQLIPVDKDIDAMSYAGEDYWGCCATAGAINRVVDAAIEPGCLVAVIGSNGFVGRGVVNNLESHDITIEKIDETSRDKNIRKIEQIPSNNDILIIISSTGESNLLNKNHIRPWHKLVVDCTFVIGQDAKGKLEITGDVSKEAYDIPQFITPVPGGIGPMEMAVLLERFMIQAFPELGLKPWKLKKLDELSAEELANYSYLDRS